MALGRDHLPAPGARLWHDLHATSPEVRASRGASRSPRRFCYAEAPEIIHAKSRIWPESQAREPNRCRRCLPIIGGSNSARRRSPACFQIRRRRGTISVTSDPFPLLLSSPRPTPRMSDTPTFASLLTQWSTGGPAARASVYVHLRNNPAEAAAVEASIRDELNTGYPWKRVIAAEAARRGVPRRGNRRRGAGGRLPVRATRPPASMRCRCSTRFSRRTGPLLVADLARHAPVEFRWLPQNELSWAGAKAAVAGVNVWLDVFAHAGPSAESDLLMGLALAHGGRSTTCRPPKTPSGSGCITPAPVTPRAGRCGGSPGRQPRLARVDQPRQPAVQRQAVAQVPHSDTDRTPRPPPGPRPACAALLVSLGNRRRTQSSRRT